MDGAESYGCNAQLSRFLLHVIVLLYIKRSELCVTACADPNVEQVTLYGLGGVGGDSFHAPVIRFSMQLNATQALIRSVQLFVNGIFRV